MSVREYFRQIEWLAGFDRTGRQTMFGVPAGRPRSGYLAQGRRAVEVEHEILGQTLGSSVQRAVDCEDVLPYQE